MESGIHPIEIRLISYWQQIKKWWLNLSSDIPFSYLTACLISIFGFIIYSNIFSNRFVFDDLNNIEGNSAIRHLSQFIQGFRISSVRFIGYLSFALNYAVHGDAVYGYHLVNLFIHVATSLIVWRLIVATLSMPVLVKEKISSYKEWIGLFCALIFVSHPVQTQAVTYMVQRFAELATLFYLLAVYAFAKAFLAGGKKLGIKLFFYAVSLFASILGFYSKEIVFTLPLILLCYSLFFFKLKISWKYIVISLFFMITALSAFFLLEQKMYQNYAFTVKKTPLQETVTTKTYALTQPKVILGYLFLIIAPISQTLDHYVPLSTNVWDLSVILPGFILLGSMILAIYLFRKNRFLSFGFVWFFLTLSVESSIIPIEDVMVEHRLYLPMFGISLIIVTGLMYLFKFQLRTMVCGMASLVCIYGLLTYNRNMVWRNGITLWTDVIKKSPKIRRAYNNLGVIYLQNNKPDMALPYFDKALELSPDYDEAMNNAGYALRQLGFVDEAEKLYQKVLTKSPDYLEANNNMGVLLMNKQQFDQAKPYFEKILSQNPESDAGNFNMGIIMAAEGRFDEAEKYYQKSISVNPNFRQMYNALPNEYKIKIK